MTTFVFLKKELVEGLRTSKVMIIAVVFILFAIVSPVTALYTNDLMKMVAGFEDIVLPDPTYLDSFIQLFKNYSFLAIITLVVVNMGTISKEKDSKTIYLVMTKGLSRSGFYMAKFLSAGIYYSLVYIVACAVFFGYTWLLFGAFPYDGVFAALVVFWVYGLFILSMTLFFSNITNNISISAMLSIGGYFFLTLLTQIKPLEVFIPARLASLPMEILTDTTTIGDSLLTVAVTLGMTLLLVIGCISILKEQEL